MVPEMNDEFIDLDYIIFCKEEQKEKLELTCDIRLFSKKDCNTLSYVNGEMVTREEPKPHWFKQLEEAELGILRDLCLFILL